MIGGVCAGLGRRLGIDPIVLRVVFIAATAAGGLGLVAYAPGVGAAAGRGRARARPPLRVPGGRDSWSVATGIGMLDVRGAAAVPPVGAVVRRRARVAGRARRRGRRADLAPVGAAPRSAGAASAEPRSSAARARQQRARAARRSASRWWSAPALLFLCSTTRWRPRATWCCRSSWCWSRPTLILAPWWMRLVRGLADERAERDPLAGARRARRAPARLGPADARADAAPGRRPARGRRARPPPGARAARLAQRRPPVRRALDLRGARSSWPPPRSRTRTACRSTSWRSATRRSTTHAEALVAAAREAIVNAAKFGERRAGVGVRRGARRRASRCSCATAGRASTPARCRPTAAACASRSSAAWSATAARAAIHSTTGEGTEVELVMARA